MDDEIVPANSFLFSELCDVLENINKNIKNKPEKEKCLSSFITNFRLNVAKVAGKKNASFFPILRLLLPDRDRERGAYNLKGSKLGELLVRVLSLSKKSDDAKALLNFRSVSNANDGDFAGVAYFVLKSRLTLESSTLTIKDINDTLDKIAAAEVGNKRSIVDTAFSYVLKTLTATQSKWFLRLILKDMKLGMGHKRILSIFHPDGPDLFEARGNLAMVCEELEDGNTRPLELGVRVFCAISPMLSERLDVTNVCRLPEDKKYTIENKFDGERFQIHMHNNEFEYFSRKGHSYADKYGKDFESGLLTPHLKDCLSPSITSFILDGEMMGWHKQYKKFGSKGMAFDIKKITPNSKYQPCFCAFDILFYNDKSLVGPPDKGGLPLHKRLQLLDSMFTDIEGVIQHSARSHVTSSSDILEALNYAIEHEEEGIVVKDTDSYYLPNKRNAGWYKIKPEYTENTMSDLDLVIIGADEAENKCNGRAKSFYVACADRCTPDAPPHRWLCIGKVATGFTYEERENTCSKLEKNWKSTQKYAPPATLVFNRETPDFWILPEHSLVLEIRATELIRNKSFGTSYTLRFPRIIKIRNDKPVNDVMTLDEFNALVENKGPVIKMSTNTIDKGQLISQPRRKRTAVAPKVAEQFRIKPNEDVKVVSNALRGRKICILSDDENCTTNDMAAIIKSHGGIHVGNTNSDVWCCIAGRTSTNYRVSSLIAAQTSDIISSNWLISLPASETPIDLSPACMLSMRPDTRLKMRRNYDAFGDSYTTETNEDELKLCFEKVDRDDQPIILTTQEMLDIDEELFEGNNPYSFLRSCFLNFAYEPTISLSSPAKFYGATICDKEEPNLTHVVFKSVHDIRLENFDPSLLIVSEDWLKKCIQEKNLISEEMYAILDRHNG